MLQRLPEARARRVFFLLWCLGWVGVAVLSLLPLAVHGYHGSDKVLHALGYAGMAAGAVTFCRDPGRLALLALLGAALGGLVEIAQAYVGRDAEWLDALANFAGATAGYLVALTALFVLRLLRRLLQDSPSPGWPRPAPERAPSSR